MMKKLFTDFPETHVAVYAAIIHRYMYDYLFYFSSNFDQTIKAFLLTLREALNTLDTLANLICLEYQMNSQPPIENLSKSSIA